MVHESRPKITKTIRATIALSTNSTQQRWYRRSLKILRQTPQAQFECIIV